MSLREYIEARSIPIPFAGCWLWLLSVGSHGYGQASIPGVRVMVAHRVSYLAFKGEIPDGALVQHSCDNKWCVNPDHLSLGTDATNAWDKQIKGRAAHKLTTDNVVSIREMLAQGERLTVIADRFRIDPRMVASIRDGHSWKHVGRLKPLTAEQIEEVDLLMKEAG